MTPSRIGAPDGSSILRSARGGGARHPYVARGGGQLVHHVIAHAGELMHVARGQRRSGRQLDGYRIHVNAVPPQCEVEMRAGRQTTGANAADHLADLYVGSYAYVAGDRLEVGIARLDAVAVIDLDVPTRATLPARVLDTPRRDRSYGSPHRGREVHAEMRTIDAEQRVKPRRRELRRDASEFQWIAQEGASERSPLRRVV